MPNMNKPKYHADVMIETYRRGQSIRMSRTFYRLLHYLNRGTNDLEVLAQYFERSPHTVYRWIRTLARRYNMDIVKGYYNNEYHIRYWGDLTPFRQLIVSRGAAYNWEHSGGWPIIADTAIHELTNKEHT